MSENKPKKTPAKKAASPKTVTKKAPQKKAPQAKADTDAPAKKRGRPPKKAAPSVTEVEPTTEQTSGIVVTANDVQQTPLRRRMLKWFERRKK